MKKPAEVLGGSSKEKPKHKGKRRYKETRIEHHHDGSHTVRHTPGTEGGGPEMSYAAQDLVGVHTGLDKNLGAPTAPQEGAPGGSGAPGIIPGA